MGDMVVLINYVLNLILIIYPFFHEDDGQGLKENCSAPEMLPLGSVEGEENDTFDPLGWCVQAKIKMGLGIRDLSIFESIYVWKVDVEASFWMNKALRDIVYARYGVNHVFSTTGWRGVNFSVASPWQRGVFLLGNGVGTYIVVVKILWDRCLTSLWDEVWVRNVPLNKVPHLYQVWV